MTTTNEWAGVCRICGLADTRRCERCPTRTRAFVKAGLMWHQRHRLLVAYFAFGLSVATAFQVVR